MTADIIPVHAFRDGDTALTPIPRIEPPAPLCVLCRHVEKTPTSYRCQNPHAWTLRTSLVTGELEKIETGGDGHSYCKAQRIGRNDEGHCGERGDWFEAREHGQEYRLSIELVKPVGAL